MKKITLVALGFTTIGMLAAATASAQANTATTSAFANARIIAPIAITKAADMNFGDVVSGVAPGTVVLTTAGTRSATGGATLGSGAAALAAAFNVTGQASATYAITLPGAPVTVTSGGNTMTVDTFVSNPSGTGTLTGGAQALLVGATLNVGATQAAGSYQGSFNVTVTYN